MPHTIRTRQRLHTSPAAKNLRNMRTFRADGYLAQLMGELDRAAISLRLAQARDEAGFTQPEMAELLIVHFRSIQNYESPKKHVLPFDRLDEWAKITGRTKEWLLHGDDPIVMGDDRLEAIEEELRRITSELAALRRLLKEYIGSSEPPVR
jgi:transcriptional regulator with XRE-family HTH domain